MGESKSECILLLFVCSKLLCVCTCVQVVRMCHGVCGGGGECVCVCK